jgi:hypothetical protein
VIKGTYHGTPIVLKRMLRSKINEEQMREFADEILLMMHLRHPNVVQVGCCCNVVFTHFPRLTLRSHTLVLTTTDSALTHACTHDD